jgi:hypothetical protein
MGVADFEDEKGAGCLELRSKSSCFSATLGVRFGVVKSESISLLAESANCSVFAGLTKCKL